MIEQEDTVAAELTLSARTQEGVVEVVGVVVHRWVGERMVDYRF